MEYFEKVEKLILGCRECKFFPLEVSYVRLIFCTKGFQEKNLWAVSITLTIFQMLVLVPKVFYDFFQSNFLLIREF